MNVYVVVMGNYIGIVDEKNKLLFHRPISKRMRQEVKYYIKSHKYKVVNANQFTWL